MEKRAACLIRWPSNIIRNGKMQEQSGKASFQESGPLLRESPVTENKSKKVCVCAASANP